MKKDFGVVALVVDKSGSMYGTEKDTKGGIKSFLEGQKAIKGETLVTMVYFDHEIDTIVDMDSIAAAEAVVDKYKPRGSTSLYDAIGMTIQSIGTKIDVMYESEKPSSITIAILTDGMENTSREYTKKMITDMIKHQTEKYDWQFMFLSSDLSAAKEAQSYGISKGNVATYTADTTTTAFFNMSSNTARYRSTGSTKGFTNEELMNMTEAKDAGDITVTSE